MLTCACLFSRSKEIVEVCRQLDNFHVRLKIIDVLSEPCRVDFFKNFSFIFLDAEFLDYETDSGKVDRMLVSFGETPVIVLSQKSSVYLGLEYCRKGFRGFIEFPCSASFLFRRTQKILQGICPDDSDEDETDLCREVNSFDSFLGESEVVKRMKVDLLRFAATEFPLFLYGETGTGKNLLASAIWKNSLRKERQFLWENLGAIPENLASSTLFGTTAGSYTDARNYPGLFEAADHGTVFLDEIESASLDVQKGLLCISEKMECKRVGTHKTYKPDVRIISACNVNLRQLVEEKKFREDLFYRLTILPVRVPTLRERLSDIPILVDFFLQKLNKGISPNAVEMLMSYTWPGNVRELYSCIRRASVLCDSAKIEMSDIRRNLNKDYEPSPELCRGLEARPAALEKTFSMYAASPSERAARARTPFQKSSISGLPVTEKKPIF